MALGQEDFGLYGVVGGLIVFMTFINSIFSSALTRFYAFSIGQMKVADDKAAALEECRAWFSAAVAVHTILPLILVAVGYPIGTYAIRNGFLAIPAERVVACIWVWRFSCFTALTTMAAAPMWAMYMGRQNIAEMTGYFMLSTLIRTTFIYCMTLFDRDWLVPYAATLCATGFLVRLAYCTQAFIIFPECRIRWKDAFSFTRWKRIGAFSGWQSFYGLGQIIKGQGMAILINKLFGAKVNAAMSVAAQLAGESAALSGALQGAFAPAVTTAYGAKEYEKMRTLAFRVCRYSTLLMLLFAVPLALEIEEVLRIWLKTPPQYASGLCLCIMAAMIIEKSSLGHTIAVAASGNVARYYFAHGVIVSSVVFFAYIFVAFGGGVYCAGSAIVITTGLSVLMDIVLAKAIVGFGIGMWLRKVIVPIIIVSFPTALFGYLVRDSLPSSFGRVCITTISCLTVFLPAVFMFLEKTEKEKLIANLKRIYRRFG